MKNYKFINNLLKPFKCSISNTETIVLISEEYGYRNHIWLPGMDDINLKRWWRRQWNIDKCFGKYWYDFPGKIISLHKLSLTRSDIYAKFDGLFLTDMFKDETWLYYNYYFDTYYTAFDKLHDSHLCYFAHIFCNDDSFLKTPSNQYIEHNGNYPAKLITEKNVKEYILNEERK